MITDDNDMLLSENRIAFEGAIERTKKESKQLLDDAILDVQKQLKTAHSEAMKEKKIENDLAVRTLQNENYEMRLKTKELEKCMKESERMSRDQEANWVRNEQQFLEEIEALRAEHEEIIKNEENETQKILQQNLTKAAVAEEKLKMDIDELTAKYMEEINAGRKSFTDLETRWKRRESRAEDLSRIAFLEGDLATKDELVTKIKEEMMYFKREMINREENFNQKFGRSPMVSIVQVTKPGSAAGPVPETMKLPPKPSTGGFGGGRPSKPSYTVGAGGSMTMSASGGWAAVSSSSRSSARSLNTSNSTAGQGGSAGTAGTGIGMGVQKEKTNPARRLSS